MNKKCKNDANKWKLKIKSIKSIEDLKNLKHMSGKTFVMQQRFVKKKDERFIALKIL